MAVSLPFEAFYARQIAYFRVQFAAASEYLVSDALHDMRVCLKRLRTFFNLIEAIDLHFRARKSFAPVRPLFRAAGRVRDLQVLEARVRQVSLADGLELSEFYNWLKQAERREGRRFRRACRRFDPRFFESSWTSMAAVLSGQPVPRVMVEAEARLADLLSDLKKEAAPARSARLHLIRIRSNEARHTLETIRQDRSSDRRSASIDKLLREVHQALGRWHDDELALGSVRKFRKGRQARPLFSFTSYLEFSRRAKERKAADLAEFRSAWTTLSRVLGK